MRRLTRKLLTLILILAAMAGYIVPTPAQEPNPPAMTDAEALRLAEQAQAQLIEVIAKVSPAYVRIGGGSGIVISPDGYMVTNYHVAEDKHFNVTLGTGKAFRATNIGQDTRGDIVLLKLDTDVALPYIEIGDSEKVQVGQTVIALGNPFLYAFDDARPTVTMGVVSALHRYQQGYGDCFQVDVRVNPGNSGGPLITMDGKWVGINGRIAVRQGFGTRINTGIGFSIPSNQIMRFVKRWRQVGGQLRHGVIDGLEVATSADGKGAVVSGVAAGKEAVRAGFKVGDVILSIDGRAVTSRNRYFGIVGTYPEGETLTIQVQRGGQAVTLKTVLAPTGSTNQAELYPAPPAEPFTRPGLPELQPEPTPQPQPTPLPTPTGGYLGLTADLEKDKTGAGCPVYRVLPGTPAERAGIKPGDVVLKFDGADIASFDDLKAALAAKSPGNEIVLEIARGRANMAVRVQLSERPNR